MVNDEGFFGSGINATGTYEPPARTVAPTTVQPAPTMAPSLPVAHSTPPIDVSELNFRDEPVPTSAAPTLSVPVESPAPLNIGSAILPTAGFAPEGGAPSEAAPEEAPSPTDPVALSSIPSFSQRFGSAGFAPPTAVGIPPAAAPAPAPSAEQVFGALPEETRAQISPDGSFGGLPAAMQEQITAAVGEQPAAPSNPIEQAFATLEAVNQTASPKGRIQIIGLKVLLERAATGDEEAQELFYRQGFGKFEHLANEASKEQVDGLVKTVELLVRENVITPINVYAEIKAQAAEVQAALAVQAAERASPAKEEIAQPEAFEPAPQIPAETGFNPGSAPLQLVPPPAPAPEGTFETAAPATAPAPLQLVPQPPAESAVERLEAARQQGQAPSAALG